MTFHRKFRPGNYLSAGALALATAWGAAAPAQITGWKLECSAGDSPRHGFGHGLGREFENLSGTRYRQADGQRAFGFDLQPSPQVAAGSCMGDAPFFVSVAVPEGNYKVTIVLGNNSIAAVTTVKAEARRLMLLQVPTRAGQTLKRSFALQVRTPHIGADESVQLKPREIGSLDWDEKLTLEFSGTHPSVRSISIESAQVPTIYLAGDSTVVDQDKEPWAAWGQVLPAFFNDKVAVANHAESGETIRSFGSEHRFEKIMSTIRRGDYLFLQFAHNDQKAGPGFVPIPEYQDLLRRYIALAHDKGARAVLVTSMSRRRFAGGVIEQTLAGYPEAMRVVAHEERTPLIDLNAMSKTLFEAMGPDGTFRAFVHYPANTFPDQPVELKDDTHFNSYGALELAKCVIAGARKVHLKITKDLRREVRDFDPAHPDAAAVWTVPADPFLSAETPYEK